MIDKDERNEDDAGADPICWRGVLRLENHLTDQRQRDGQTETDGDDQRRGEKHGKSPGEIG